MATYHASLNRGAEGQLLRDLSTPGNEQAQDIAEAAQINAPDVVLVHEFDHVPGGRSAEALPDHHLSASRNGTAPQDDPYHWTAPVNTGVPSRRGLDQNGSVGGPGDAWGLGQFPGQHVMVVYSTCPIEQLLGIPRIRDPLSASSVSVEAAALQGGANHANVSDPSFDIGGLSDTPAPGSLRTDCVLLSRNLQASRSGVFWPKPGEPGSGLTSDPAVATDHHLARVDVKAPGRR